MTLPFDLQCEIKDVQLTLRLERESQLYVHRTEEEKSDIWTVDEQDYDSNDR